MNEPNKINDGGSAFPVTASTGDPRDGVYCRDGMTLRDWFASQAMAAMLSNSYTGKKFHEHQFSREEQRTIIAVNSYDMADAMITQRTQQP